MAKFCDFNRFESSVNGHKRRTIFTNQGGSMIIIGLVLMLIGFLTKITILWSLGILVAVVGLVLLLLGAAGREIGGRKHYY